MLIVEISLPFAHTGNDSLRDHYAVVVTVNKKNRGIVCCSYSVPK